MSQLENQQEQKYQRVTAILKGWREQTSLACEAYWEAKTSKVWELHHNSWKEYVESCGFTEQWGLQLSKTGQRIAELRQLLETDPVKLSLTGAVDLPTKVSGLTPGTRRVLDGIPTAQQLEVLAKTKSPKPTVKEVQKAKAEVVRKPVAPIQGREKISIRSFVQMEGQLGAVLRRLDDLHRDVPNRVHHDAAIRLVKECMGEVKQWQKEAR
jgi:hypothetical protein